MPCSDGGVPYPPSNTELAERAFNKRAPSLLCSACRALDRLGYDFDENPELSGWWAKHKAEDDARAERERDAAERLAYARRVINAALKKPVSDLSFEEKQLLKAQRYL